MPPPYVEIADLLSEGKVVPFLGAGVNFGMRPPEAAWDEQTSAFLPSGAELSRYLAHRINFPSDDPHDLKDLAKVSSYYVEISDRRLLRRRLQNIFAREYAPSSIHLYLAEVARKSEEETAAQPDGAKEPGTALLVVTTNYDDLLEQAFRRLGRPYDLVVYPTDRKENAASVLWWRHGADEPEYVVPNRLCIDLKNTNVIYKMHGSVDRGQRNLDSFVITEDDYIDFLSRMMTQGGAVPAQFMRYFRTRHFLFLGYGLGDWNLRVVLKNLKTVLPSDEAAAEGARPDFDEDEGELTSWAIQFRPTDLEKELWRARRVRIFDEDINTFVRGLRGEGAE